MPDPLRQPEPVILGAVLVAAEQVHGFVVRIARGVESVAPLGFRESSASQAGARLVSCGSRPSSERPSERTMAAGLNLKSPPDRTIRLKLEPPAVRSEVTGPTYLCSVNALGQEGATLSKVVRLTDVIQSRPQ